MNPTVLLIDKDKANLQKKKHKDKILKATREKNLILLIKDKQFKLSQISY